VVSSGEERGYRLQDRKRERRTEVSPLERRKNNWAKSHTIFVVDGLRLSLGGGVFAWLLGFS